MEEISFGLYLKVCAEVAFKAPLWPLDAICGVRVVCCAPEGLHLVVLVGDRS